MFGMVGLISYYFVGFIRCGIAIFTVITSLNKLNIVAKKL